MANPPGWASTIDGAGIDPVWAARTRNVVYWGRPVAKISQAGRVALLPSERHQRQVQADRK